MNVAQTRTTAPESQREFRDQFASDRILVLMAALAVSGVIFFPTAGALIAIFTGLIATLRLSKKYGKKRLSVAILALMVLLLLALYAPVLVMQ